MKIYLKCFSRVEKVSYFVTKSLAANMQKTIRVLHKLILLFCLKYINSFSISSMKLQLLEILYSIWGKINTILYELNMQDTNLIALAINRLY